MLKLYNASGGFVRMISDTDYTDLNIVSTLKDGDKQLSFTYLNRPSTLQNEGYVLTDTDRYVIKELRPARRSTQVVCKLDLEALEKDMFQQFTAANKTVAQMAALALVGTGWTVNCNMTKKRSVQCYKKTPLDILYKITEAFMCELSFDTINKVVTFAEQLGSDKGVYFRADLNLQSLSPTYDSYDYYTRLIPIGADGLTIEDVNGGKNYVENTTYSSKVRTLIWEDTSYEDATELKTDAIGKLSDMAAPKRSYSAQIIDFSRLRGDDTMSFELGDTILITDEATQTMEKQRIVKITEYPDAPEKNSVELSNTTLTWEEMQARYQKAAQAWEDVSNSDGTVNGVYVHGVQAGEVVGVEVVTGSGTTKTDLNTAVSTVQSSISVVTSDLQAATARIGTIETTYLQATMANLDTANITTAKIKDLFVQVGFIKDATISGARITGYLDAVEVNAANITAGTLVADRIAIRGNNKSIVYALNNYGTLTSTQVNTLDGYVLTPRTINADKIIAGTITANEITANNLVGTGGWINLRNGTFNYGAGKLTWNGSEMYVGGWSIDSAHIKKEFTLGTDTYTVILRTSGGATSHNVENTIRPIEVFKTPSGGSAASQFYVGSDGYLYAGNANIKGAISASEGDIGGFTIDANSIRSAALTSNASGSVGLSSSTFTRTINGTSRSSLKFAIGANFGVSQTGVLYAGSAVISGSITATSGTIGGWGILGSRLEIDRVADGGYRTGMQCLADGSGTAFYAGCTTAAGGTIGGNSAFYVTQAGAVYCSKLTVDNTNCQISNTHILFGKQDVLDSSSNVYTEIKKSGLTIASDTSYGLSSDYLSLTNKMLTISTMEGSLFGSKTRVGQTGIRLDDTTLEYDVSGRLWVDSGYFGLYSINGSKWIIRADDSGDVSIPSACTVSGRMTFSAAPVSNNNIYYCSKNTDGAVVPVIGWSSGNNMWVGHYTFANRSSRITLGATASELYIYNTSGSQVLLTTAVSDRRLKHDIKDLTGSKDLIMGLSAKSFKLNGEERERYGFIAQEAKSLVPYGHALIEYNPTGEDTDFYDPDDEGTFEYSMDYIQLIAPIVAMIQEHEHQIDALIKQMEGLRHGYN